MGRAEDVARARQAAAAAEKERARREQAERVVADMALIRGDIDELIPQVMGELRRLDYPDAVLQSVRVRRRWPLNGSRFTSVASWLLCERYVSATEPVDDRTERYWLRSDGSIDYGYDVETMRLVLSSLEALYERLRTRR